MKNSLVDTYRSVGGAVQAARYYTMERISRKDPLTDTPIMQLTSFPILNHTLYYHCPCITPDSKTVIFLSYTRSGRISSPDVWRVNLDGSDLAPVVERPWLSGFVMSPDGKTVYAQDGGTLVATPMTGGDTAEIGHIDGVAAPATLLGSITSDGEYYVSTAQMESGRTALVRYATDGSDAGVLLEEDYFSHVQIDPAGSRILFCGPEREKRTEDLGPELLITDIDGGNMRKLDLPYSTGHFGWFGTTGNVLSTVREPFGSIVVAGENEPMHVVAKGGHYWHAAGTMDGEWIVTDTNWPDMGLILINTESGLWAPLCQPQSSCGHPQWTHPHPMFSPDGKYVVYNSDATGVGQIYAAEVSQEIRDRLA